MELQAPYKPPRGVFFDSSQGTKDENSGESYLHSPVADAIINSGPREADANPIQISDGGRQTLLLRSGQGESSGARSCHRSSPESRRSRWSRWIPRRLHHLQSRQGSGRQA